MRAFTQHDIDNLKSGNVGKEQVKELLPSAIENSRDLRADVRNFDEKTGHYEIILTGTLNPDVLRQSQAGARTGQQAGV